MLWREDIPVFVSEDQKTEILTVAGRLEDIEAPSPPPKSWAAGILSNLEGFADTYRHGVLFYTMVLLLTVSGMTIGGIVPALFKVTNSQIRAVSLETGLRNASLAMTIALLIQDSMGDFHSSMFWVSGMFGLSMYLPGLIAIKIYLKIFCLTWLII